MSAWGRRVLGLVIGGFLVIAPISTARAAAPDPIKSDVWGKGFTGTYRFASNVPSGWMRSAISRAIATISSTSYANPTFRVTTSSTANGTIQYLKPSSNSCDGDLSWRACADAYSDKPFRLWLASDTCWTDGTNSTCGGTKYDVETVALNEMGHINRLSHHVNPAYSDAVVQLTPYPYGQIYGTNRFLRWADNDGLHALYGHDPCTLPPCPLEPVP
ncbi:MAG: hypothetical protein HYX57_01380 [Chloroflexi bacterium]|nr:hypothetical protein [Chloroflexota bacterium]